MPWGNIGGNNYGVGMNAITPQQMQMLQALNAQQQQNQTMPYSLNPMPYGSAMQQNLGGFGIDMSNIFKSSVTGNLAKDTALNQASQVTSAVANNAGGEAGSLSGLASMGKNLLGLATGSAGTSLLGDAVGGLGTMLGNKMMKGIFGGGSSQASSATNAAADAAQKAIDVVSQNKSSLLQNTNAAGQQGNQAALSAQQKLNGQMVSGDAVADKNRLLSSGIGLQQNAMSMANQGMRQNQMSQQNIASQVKNMMAGGPTAKLGNLGALQQSATQGNLAALQQGQQSLQQAAGQQAGIASQASDIYNKDLANSFERTVKPYLNQWENFQSMGGQLAGQMAGAASSIANSADNASYNLLGGTASMLGTRADTQNAAEQTLNWMTPMNLATSMWG